jgi:hypothetical protein
MLRIFRTLCSQSVRHFAPNLAHWPLTDLAVLQPGEHKIAQSAGKLSCRRIWDDIGYNSSGASLRAPVEILLLYCYADQTAVLFRRYLSGSYSLFQAPLAHDVLTPGTRKRALSMRVACEYRAFSGAKPAIEGRSGTNHTNGRANHGKARNSTETIRGPRIHSRAGRNIALCGAQRSSKCATFPSQSEVSGTSQSHPGSNGDILTASPGRSEKSWSR